MGDEATKQLLDEIQSVRREIGELKVAITGDPVLKLDGVHQHVDGIRRKVDGLEKDVKSLKTDRIKIIAWVTGGAAGIGAAGSKLVDWLRM